MFHHLASKATQRVWLRTPNKLTANKGIVLLAAVSVSVLILSLIGILYAANRPAAQRPSHQTIKTVPKTTTKNAGKQDGPSNTDTTTPTTTASSKPVSASTTQTAPVNPAPPKAGALPYGTPHVTYSYTLDPADKDTEACNYIMSMNVNVDNWQGYSSGNIVINMILHSRAFGDYPYTTTYALSKGETKVFTHTFSVPTTVNGDNITWVAKVSPVSGNLGDVMMITDVTPGSATGFGWNCF